jgi:CRISPR-associated protein Cas2
MTYIVTYDISENRIRNRLAIYLETFGVRLQKSVFAVAVERHALNRFLAGVKRITGDSDRVIVFRLCSGCEKSAVQLNDEKPREFIF